MRTILNKIVILCAYLFVFITLVSFNQLKVMTENVFEGEYVRVVFKADTTYVPNDFRLITTQQIRSENLCAIFKEFGVEELMPVFRNRYNNNGQLKRNFKGNEKDSWFIVSAKMKSPKTFVDKLNSVTGIDNAYIEESVIVPCDTTYSYSTSLQWFLNSDQGVNVQDAWTINRGRSDIVIAVCDGGVDYNHPNLDPGNRSRVIAGYDTGSDDDDPMDDLPDVPHSFANHGTHIAGIIGANPTSTHNISGVMQNCKIMPVKVVGSGGIKYPFKDVYAWDFSSTAFPSDIADGIDYAVSHGAHVINLSIGFRFPNIPLFDVISGLNVLVSSINNAYDNNVLIVAAMGNDGNGDNLVEYPAGLPHVLAVGSVDRLRIKASSSSTGSHISVCAPGVLILSTERNGGTVTKNGTSMATPVVCGVAGLIISQGKDRGFNLTNDDVRQILERTADDVGTQGFDSETGHGIVNAYSALQLLSSPNNLLHGISYGGTSNKINTLDKWSLSKPCYALAAGMYLDVDQYQITKHITFDTPFLSPPDVWFRERESLALSFDTSPNNGSSYVEITNITNTGFDIRYATYYVRYNSIGQTINRWIPENLSSTKIAYTVVGVLAPSISGPSQICIESTYIINNLPTGATVTWSASPTDIVSIQTSGNNATITATSRGLFNLSAIVAINGNTFELTKEILSVGTPYIYYLNSSNLIVDNDCSTCFNVLRNYDNSQYQGSLTVASTSEGTSFQWSKVSGSMEWHYNQNTVTVNSKNKGCLVLACTATNECGSTVEYYTFCAGPAIFAKIYPNPATDILYFDLTNNEIDNISFSPINSAKTIEPYSIQLWNEHSGLVKSIESNQPKLQISLKGLPKGMYYVHIIINEQITQKELLWIR